MLAISRRVKVEVSSDLEKREITNIVGVIKGLDEPGNKIPHYPVSILRVSVEFLLKHSKCLFNF